MARGLPKNRSFSYEPRYYDPQKEEREGHRIKFKRNKSQKIAKQRSMIWLFVVLAAVVYFIYFFANIGK